MHRKVKTIPLENTLNKVDEDSDTGEAKADTYDAVINLIQDENIVDIEDIIPPTVEKVKKVRFTKKKTVDPPIAVSEDEETDDTPVIETTIVIDEVDKKKDENIKVVELLQCEKCGKKLTARTLKYSHNSVCPANENKTTPKPKRVKPDDSEPNVDVETPKVSNKVERIKKRQETFNNLFSNAV